ncbi:subtilase-type protease inhibitor [Streptomyces sp. NPDC050264]|uniref:subtilase-type protease inhibitor n=1 Tax=Streptomyces sp. NPDC050264 TaxID=3155038 RepID=UPI003423FD37
MPITARLATAITLTATALLGPLSGTALPSTTAPSTTAPAATTPSTTSLYAPSALVLTVAHGDSAASAAPDRAVTLSCAPKPSGTHPSTALACSQIAGVDGDFGKLSIEEGAVCTRKYDPVTVTAQGVWRGTRVAYERTFANECVKRTESMAVFAF